MIQDLILRDRTPKTIKAYTGRVADFARYFHASPDRLGPEHVRSYLLHLIQERQASWNIYRQARQAPQFFYTIILGREWVVARVARPKVPKTLPVVLSTDEMARFLDALENPKHRALLMTAYAAGLRLSEVAHLRVEDIDSTRMVIHVRRSKGQKDSDVMLSPRLLAVLREYWKACRPGPFLFPGPPGITCWRGWSSGPLVRRSSTSCGSPRARIWAPSRPAPRPAAAPAGWTGPIRSRHSGGGMAMTSSRSRRTGAARTSFTAGGTLASGRRDRDED
jgi:integrase